MALGSLGESTLREYVLPIKENDTLCSSTPAPILIQQTADALLYRAGEHKQFC